MVLSPEDHFSVHLRRRVGGQEGEEEGEGGEGQGRGRGAQLLVLAWEN